MLEARADSCQGRMAYVLKVERTGPLRLALSVSCPPFLGPDRPLVSPTLPGTSLRCAGGLSRFRSRSRQSRVKEEKLASPAIPLLRWCLRNSCPTRPLRSVHLDQPTFLRLNCVQLQSQPCVPEPEREPRRSLRCLGDRRSLGLSFCETASPTYFI